MKILVLTDKYFPRPYANAICAQELIEVWTTQGHQIDVLAYADFEEKPKYWKGNPVHYVRPDLRLRLYYYSNKFGTSFKGKLAEFCANILSKVKGIFLLPWQPFYSCSFPRRIFKTMERLYSERKYDAVVAILKPIDSCIAACKFKTKHSNIPFVVYSVDTLKKGFIEKHFNVQFADGFFWEKKILSSCDAFFYMQSRRHDYLHPRYDGFRNKLFETDLPRLKPRDLSKITPFDFGEQAEHWVYAGAIGGVHYNPEKMIEIFLKISENPRRILHLYVRGSVAEQIALRAEREKLNIRVHDYVDSSTLERILASADVLVSFKTSNQISAKIFENIAYGKPIVHFSGIETDPNKKYLKKYALCYIVNTYEGDFDQKKIDSLERFLKESRKTHIETAEILKIFEKNTPQYSADMLVTQIKKANKEGEN